jgi:lipopolysaccharide transport system ATP-binding protein
MIALRKEQAIMYGANTLFEVERGEVLNNRKNGAGKSTLLKKILSRVTASTTGSIKLVVGSSCLEVETGSNGEMTGRENIY